MNKQRKWDTFDVVKGVLRFLPERKFYSNTRALHKSLYNVTQNEQVKYLFDDYIFDSSSGFPYSREFQTDMLNLELSGHLSTINPSLAETNILPKLEITFDLYQKDLFTKEDITNLTFVAEKFYDLISQ